MVRIRESVCANPLRPVQEPAVSVHEARSRSGLPTDFVMLEIAVLVASALPFVVGLYALKVLERRRRGGDDRPPPPDEGPPPPVQPNPGSPARRLRSDRSPSGCSPSGRGPSDRVPSRPVRLRPARRPADPVSRLVSRSVSRAARRR
jgi:hypothetical protein